MGMGAAGLCVDASKHACTTHSFSLGGPAFRVAWGAKLIWCGAACARELSWCGVVQHVPRACPEIVALLTSGLTASIGGEPAFALRSWLCFEIMAPLVELEALCKSGHNIPKYGGMGFPVGGGCTRQNSKKTDVRLKCLESAVHKRVHTRQILSARLPPFCVTTEL
eukprot:1145431-Pelagomonas_calceolata.AAC.9